MATKKTVMLKELTAEQEAVLEIVANEYLTVLQRGDEMDMEGVRPGLDLIYSMYDAKTPEIEIMDSPPAALLRAKELGIASPFFDWAGAGRAGWTSRYETYRRLGVLMEEEQETIDFCKIRNLLLNGVYDTILCDDRALVVRLPAACLMDADSQLHAERGPAISWRDGYAEWLWHGVFVTQQIIETPESIDAKAAMALNTEERRALAERLGWGSFLSLIGCEKISDWSDPTTGLGYELFRAPDQNIIRKQSPALQNKSQPYYCEPVHSELTSAQAARKWQAVCRRTMDPAAVARACNKKPELRYRVEA